MIPEKPRKFDPSSLEGIMFNALEELPQDYYVLHSFRITNVNNNVFHESETDFIIFNRRKGVICLEAKAGQVRYENGEWLYSNGIPMHNDGPFNQASSNNHKVRKHIQNSNLSLVLNKCKFLHAVWFPSITSEQLNRMDLPSEADKALILTKEALDNPLEFIESIFDVEIYFRGVAVHTNLSETESNRLVREIFCPEISVFPSSTFEADLKKIVFRRLLKEQTAILNFLDDQKTASINGVAGTGKTMIATEKARRHALDGEKVLFLCFNTKLKEYLESNYYDSKIAYYTIAGFVCKLCDSSSPDYTKAKCILEDMYIAGSFPYRHVIIDEGQDFGNEIIEEADIVQLIYDIISDHEELGGSFYIFYDKLQLVQAKKMPKIIENLDCRLTLYRNCRNTENIATTSLKPVTARKPKLFEDAVKGAPAKIHFCNDTDDELQRLETVIESVKSDGYNDIVILTCATEETSIFSEYVCNGKYKNKYMFTTCRKFKGLEADAVILVDVSLKTFREDVLVYYVGASRARLRLDVLAVISDEECNTVLKDILNYSGKIRRPKKDFASALNAIGSLQD